MLGGSRESVLAAIIKVIMLLLYEVSGILPNGLEGRGSRDGVTFPGAYSSYLLQLHLLPTLL